MDKRTSTLTSVTLTRTDSHLNRIPNHFLLTGAKTCCSISAIPFSTAESHRQRIQLTEGVCGILNSHKLIFLRWIF
ncbi:hypothetical protein CSKR_203333 [Clonorchis sinensis]|uniref:Uncharacterized protein n=1 Tax=Clonorchis sinensis TaxID=79923 RepID=A0A8T1MAJ5_CLOSI|nr:hypothetical protein CSKR_203333 [Clonorchis sinensis]